MTKQILKVFVLFLAATVAYGQESAKTDVLIAVPPRMVPPSLPLPVPIYRSKILDLSNDEF